LATPINLNAFEVDDDHYVRSETFGTEAGTLFEYECSPAAAGAEFVFRFTPETTGQYLIWTDGAGATAGVDTIVSIYTACSPGASELACQDDLDGEGGNFLSGFYADLTADVTLYIVVESFDAADFGSNFELEVQLTSVGRDGDACNSDTITQICDWDRGLGCVWTLPGVVGPGTCEPVGGGPVIIDVEEVSTTLGYTPTGAIDDRCPFGATYDVATYRITSITNENLVVWTFQNDAFGPDPLFFLLDPPAVPSGAGFAVVEQDLCYPVGGIPTGAGEPVTWSVMDDLGERGFVPGMTAVTGGAGGTVTGRLSVPVVRTY
jgi:hypothetical protein